VTVALREQDSTNERSPVVIRFVEEHVVLNPSGLSLVERQTRDPSRYLRTL